MTREKFEEVMELKTRMDSLEHNIEKLKELNNDSSVDLDLMADPRNRSRDFIFTLSRYQAERLIAIMEEELTELENEIERL